MEKPQNKYIAVTYRLYTVENNESELIEETSQDRPFLFISGFGVTLESFEKHIAGLEKRLGLRFHSYKRRGLR